MRRFRRFLAVGALGLLVDAGLTLALAAEAGLPPLAARVPAFVLATIVTYALNRRYTFGPGGRERGWLAGWLAYVIATSIGAAINFGVYSGVVVALGPAPVTLLGGVVLGSVIALAFNFTVSQRIIFRPVRPVLKAAGPTGEPVTPVAGPSWPGSALGIVAVVLAVSVLASLCFLGLNLASRQVPEELLRDRITTAFATGALTTADRLHFDEVRGDHQYNDCLILSMALLRGPDPLTDALAPRIPVKDPARTGHASICGMLEALATGERGRIETVPYTRYWHGLPALSALLLAGMELDTLRQAFKWTFRLLLGGIALLGLILGSRASTPAERLPLLGGAVIAGSLLLFWGGDYFAQSLTDFLPALLLSGALAVLMLTRPLACSLPGLAAFAAAFGAGTIYLEFLSGPIPLGAALLTAMLALHAAGTLPWQAALLRLGIALGAYCGAIVCTYLLKTLATASVLGDGVFGDTLRNLALRLSASAPAPAGADVADQALGLIDLINALRWSLPGIAWGSSLAGYLLMTIALVQLAVGLLWLLSRGRRMGALALPLAGVLASAAVIPCWYLLFMNHSVVHAWFMVRLLVWPIAAGWLVTLIIALECLDAAGRGAPAAMSPTAASARGRGKVSGQVAVRV
jgi:putative flippase GtrA